MTDPRLIRFVRLIGGSVLVWAAFAQQRPPKVATARAFLEQNCVSCHNQGDEIGGLALDKLDVGNVSANPQVWEKVVRKLRIRLMPPPSEKRPEESAYQSIIGYLETSLDAASAAKLNPGRTETLRRLNRTEYQNSIRDLLSLDIDATSMLPADESGYGFDNVTVGDLSPTLLDRYISAAQKISRLAVGTMSSMQSDTINLRADLTQEDQLPGMPIGTRGGLSTTYTFAQDGEYEIQVLLMRSIEGIVSGLRDDRKHEMLVLIDREPVHSFTVSRESSGTATLNEKPLKARFAVKAGPHQLAVTFVKESSSLIDTAREPSSARFNDRRHPRTAPAVDQVVLTGPYSPKGAGDTPSRRRLFVCRPVGTGKVEEEKCAGTILSTLMRRAYRRPVVKAEVEGPMAFFRKGRSAGDFDAGITAAVTAVLTNAEFLFRVESDPKRPTANGVYRISDLELASRLSFFLWSSIPDDELLNAAVLGKLSQPAEFEKQARRMLADRRSVNLATNFAGQWLRLRNVDEVNPSANIFRDFDDNLRQAFRRETELFFDSVLREDRSVRTFIKSDYTFLNERLAKHYGIPNVYGSRFRRVTLGPESKRGGLLRQASVLSVTSYATRTSPILRGVMVLSNIIGAPPPPPPPDVPALDESEIASNLTMRERLAAHRSNAVCASCHRTIDPVGFSLENFDAVGKWRDLEVEGQPVDASGALPGDAEFQGVDGLERALLRRPEMFVSTFTESLMTFGLGRGVEYYDAPAVRKIVSDAEKDGYKFSSIIVGIVKSVPFQMRRAEMAK
jgi:mono/diheme cytochrome c family protein